MTDPSEYRQVDGLAREQLRQLQRELQAATEDVPDLLDELPSDLVEQLLSDDELSFEQAINDLKLRAAQRPAEIPDWARPVGDPPGEFDTVDLGAMDTVDLGDSTPPADSPREGGSDPDPAIPPVSPPVFLPGGGPIPQADESEVANEQDDPLPSPREQLLAYRQWQRKHGHRES